MGELWWQQISNAKRFIKSIVGYVQAGDSVVLYMPECVPYPQVFESIVLEKLHDYFSQHTVEDLDLTMVPIDGVGTYMLNRYCKPNKRVQYRGVISIAKFLAQSDDIVFHHRLFWVHNIPSEDLEEWVDFVNDYNSNRKEDVTRASFILDCEDETMLRYAKGSVKAVSFNSTISDYDKYAFCTIIASENSCKASVRDYLGQLASSCCMDDIELAALCVDEGERFLADPVNTLAYVSENKSRSDGAEFISLGSESEIERYIWTAQIRTVFPKLEKYRASMVEKFKDAIQLRLDSKPILDASGEEITSAFDVELGTLCRLSKEGVFRLTLAETDKLIMYKDARNKLAHLSSIDFDIVEKILAE